MAFGIRLDKDRQAKAGFASVISEPFGIELQQGIWHKLDQCRIDVRVSLIYKNIYSHS